MTSSLVGSEMCIRDSWIFLQTGRDGAHGSSMCSAVQGVPGRSEKATVSYTHLTLPTICSV
eukprot:8921637-Prorocentrum_lima.AAC.1